jgi:signal peptidase II
MSNSKQTSGSSKPIQIVAVFAVALTAGLLDQLSKWIASEALSPDQPVWLIQNVLGLHLKSNPNGAFGLFASFPESFRLPVLIALGVLALLTITAFTIHTVGFSTLASVSLGLIMGGAVSNLLDRTFREGVVDFIDMHFGARLHWPTFNIADLAITVGSLILAGTLIRTWIRKWRTVPE